MVKSLYNKKKIKVGLLEVKDNVIKRTNPNAFSLLMPSKTIIGKEIDTIFCGLEMSGRKDDLMYILSDYNGREYIVIIKTCSLPDKNQEVLFFPIDEIKPQEQKKKAFEENFESFIPILESMHENVLITDGEGIILKTYKSFEEVFGIGEAEIVGKSVYDAEREGIFKPSLVAIALKKKKKITMLQESLFGGKFVVNAVPVVDEKGKIIRVITYSSSLDELSNIKDIYEEMQALENKMKRYSLEIKELREKEIKFPEVISESLQTKNLLKLLVKVAEVDINLLITGESGVGKNVFAKLTHQHSSRKDGPFIEINCAAIPESLLESELFGYEPGAFTGALREGKLGLIELAHKGTLFLDEIGELSLNLQAKLLKFIQEKVITRIGSTKPNNIDCRIIAATNKELAKEIQKGNFREDLYYRINIVPIKIPPIRERIEDILSLMNLFLEEANKKYGKQKTFSSSAINAMLQYQWPGNVRELKNIIERMVITAEEDKINSSILPFHLQKIQPNAITEGQSLKQIREAFEKEIFIKAYERFKTTVAVAEHLKITQATASRKIKKYIRSIQ